MSFYDLKATFRPIDVWPGEPTRRRQRSRFDSPWSFTVDLLGTELRHLGAKNIVCQVAIDDRYIRQDGYPYANAKASHPGVILAFDSKFGPLKYATDTYDDWQDNVRAIAVSLQALRKVDRHGVSKRGEQYTGWKALPAQSSASGIEDAATAITFLSAMTGESEAAVRADPVRAGRIAARRTHPDTGGNREQFQLVQRSREVLGV